MGRQAKQGISIKWKSGGGQNDDLDALHQKEAEKQEQLLESKFAALRNGNAPVISVIVPCYNVQPYLSACIDSILNQTINELLEIIVVDNYSTDDTAAIMRQYEQEHDNIRAFYRDENGGVSVSRNLGMRAARGKYLVFCDADDTVPQDGYEKLLRRAEETNADVVVGNAMRIYAEGMYLMFNSPEETVFEKCLFFPVVWNKLIRQDFLLRHHVEFDPECQCQEDILFTAQLMKNEPHCEVENSVVYEYHEEREGQRLSKESSYKAVSCLFYVLNLIYNTKPLHHFRHWKKFFNNLFRPCLKIQQTCAK